jgi:spermidine synthase
MSFALALGVAALAGFISLAYEILWYRAFSFVNKGSPMTFGLLLGFYLVGIAFGSLLSRAWCKRRKDVPGVDHARAFAPDVRLLAGFVFFAQIVAWSVLPILGLVATRASWMWALFPVAASAMLLGAALPLVAHFGIAPDDRAGARLSYVYLANIIGSASGSLVVGYVLLDAWSIERVALTLAMSGFVLASGLVLAGGGRAPSWIALAIAMAATWKATPVAFDRIWEKLQFKADLQDGFRFAEIVETKSGVITVTPGGEVYGGGAYDGIFNAGVRYDRNGIFRTYALGAMRPSYDDALMIGLASGSWAQVVVNLPGIRKLTVVEINPGYLEIIANHPEASWLLHDPRVEIVIDDGRRWLQRHPERRFDLIVQNTTWHWRAHITNLLSREYMQLVRSRLTPGGVFFFNTTWSEDALVTALSTFSHGIRVWNCLAVSDGALDFDRARWQSLLRGFRIQSEPVLDLSAEHDRVRLEELVAYVDTLTAPPTREGLESKESMLARFTEARVITDDNMVPEWRDDFSVQIAR